jgi:hypothetical protein
MSERRARHPRPSTVTTVTKEDTKSLGEDPLSSEAILEQTFYRPQGRKSERPAKEKPTHYKVISISLYQEDIELLEEMVAELKRRGHSKANKSQLIRIALHRLDLDTVPRGY